MATAKYDRICTQAPPKVIFPRTVWFFVYKSLTVKKSINEKKINANKKHISMLK